MADFSLPSWLQAADPAKYAAHGMQLGIELGAKQAAQRFAEQQAIRDQQEQAMKLARVDIELGLRQQEQQAKIAEVARRAQAQEQYRAALEAGEDPVKALLKFGPMIGSPHVGEAAAVLAKSNRPAPTWRYEQVPGGGMVAISSEGGIRPMPVVKPSVSYKQETRTVNGVPILGQTRSDTGFFSPIASGFQRAGTLTQQQRAELRTIKDNIASLEKSPYSIIENPDTYEFKKGAPYTKEGAKAYQAKLKALRDRQAEIESGNATTTQGLKILNIRPKGGAAAPDEVSDEANGGDVTVDTSGEGLPPELTADDEATQ